MQTLVWQETLSSISRYKGKTENAVQAWTWPTSLPSQTETLIEAEINAFKEKLPVGYVIEQERLRRVLNQMHNYFPRQLYSSF